MNENPYWQTILLSKQGRVITELAGMLLDHAPGERFPSVQELAKALDASVGTIQAAVTLLQAEKVVALESRGRLGTSVRDLNYPRLWTLAAARAMVGVLPLPYSRQLEGLATGLRAGFTHHPLELALRFVRGANARLQMLQTRQSDWAVVSRYAAETAPAHGFHLEIALSFGPDTYTINQVLLLRGSQNALRDGMRVGIDFHSTDHAYIVRSVVHGMRITYVEMDYSQGLNLLDAGAIDATVWTHDEVPLTGDFTVQPLPALDTMEPLGEAVLVTRPGERGVASLVRSVVKPAEVHQIQQDVVARMRLPSY